MSAERSQRQVLVASDVPYSRMLLRHTLEQEGCGVKAATEVDDAMRLLQEDHFDLVVIDLANPPGATEQLLLHVRVAGLSVPLLLMLQNLDRDLLRRLNNLRPVGFLPKPINVELFHLLLPLALSADPNLLVESANLARFGKSGDTVRDARPGEGGALGGESVGEAHLQRIFGQLPPLPHVLTSIIKLSSQESTTAQELADVISGDPRLSGQLLRIVNSAYFGFSRRVATVPEATVILGIQAIRNLAVGASVSGFFGGKSQLVDRSRLWRHSLAVAVAGRKLAQISGSVRPEEAFTSGLLHDFGRLCLERHMAPAYGEVLAKARQGEVTLLEAEESILGVSHAWVSGWLARRWNLPIVLSEALTWHHQPESAAEGSRQMAAVVNAADVSCHLSDLGGIEGVLPTTEPSVYGLGLVGLGIGTAVEVGPSVVEETRQLEEQLSQVAAAD